MPKKEVQHINSDKKYSKAMAKAKGQEMINVKWEKTPSWTIHSYTSSSTNDKNEYKFFTEEGNKGNDDYDTES